MVYSLFRALPGDRLSCHRHRRYRFRQLDASVGASGPHVFAVRFSIIRPHALARMTPPRPLHPAPNVRDDRDAPLLWERNGETDKPIRLFGKSEYFFKRGWTAAERQLHLICPSGKIRCSLRRAEREIVVVRVDLPDVCRLCERRGPLIAVEDIECRDFELFKSWDSAEMPVLSGIASPVL